LSQSKTSGIMSCRLSVRQCISATVDRNNGALGGKFDASFVRYRPLCRACCHPRLSAHPVRDRRDPLPAFANLLGLSGRGDRAARALGRGRDGHCPALPLPSLGHCRVRSGAQNLAKPCAVVASVELRPTRPRWTRRGIGSQAKSPETVALAGCLCCIIFYRSSLNSGFALFQTSNWKISNHWKKACFPRAPKSSFC
jgi:hypothetical protein